MKRTLLAALTTLALVGCSHANKDASADATGGSGESTESVAKSGDERVQAQDSRQESDATVYDGPSATGGSGGDIVADDQGNTTSVDNAPTEGRHQTHTADGATDATGGSGTDPVDGTATRDPAAGGSGVEASSEVEVVEEGTGGSGETTGSSSMDSSMDAAEDSAESAAQDAEQAAEDMTGTGGSGTTSSSTSTTTKTQPCPDPTMKK